MASRIVSDLARTRCGRVRLALGAAVDLTALAPALALAGGAMLFVVYDELLLTHCLALPTGAGGAVAPVDGATLVRAHRALAARARRLIALLDARTAAAEVELLAEIADGYERAGRRLGDALRAAATPSPCQCGPRSQSAPDASAPAARRDAGAGAHR